MSIIHTGSSTTGNANVDTQFNLQVALPNTPANVGSVRLMSEVDSGSITGVPYLISPETDDDFRLRTSQDNFLDFEIYNYTAQNTSKHFYVNTTMTNAWTAAGMTTNSGNITTTTTGTIFKTYKAFPYYGSTSTYIECRAGFSAQPTTNTIIDFGTFLPGAANPYAPTDGVYFRLTSAGLMGVMNSNGTETTTSPFSFTYTNNQKYKFIVIVTLGECEFWINDILYGTLSIPTGQGTPMMGASAPFAVRHAITGGAAGAALSMVLNANTVTVGGTNIMEDMGTTMNRMIGAYEGLSGGTVGQLIAGTVTSGSLVKPTAAVPLNASLAANLPNNLGGRIYETLTSGLAANVDGIFAQYLIPAGTANIQGRRLRLNGIKLSGTVATVVVGGPAITEWYITFGNTATSLATAEATNAKAPRRIMLPELTTIMPAAAAAGALLQQPYYYAAFANPIYVNPGEYLSLVGNKTITTAITSGILAFTYQFDYSWE